MEISHNVEDNNSEKTSKSPKSILLNNNKNNPLSSKSKSVSKKLFYNKIIPLLNDKLFMKSNNLLRKALITHKFKSEIHIPKKANEKQHYQKDFMVTKIINYEKKLSKAKNIIKNYSSELNRFSKIYKNIKLSKNNPRNSQEQYLNFVTKTFLGKGYDLDKISFSNNDNDIFCNSMIMDKNIGKNNLGELIIYRDVKNTNETKIDKRLLYNISNGICEVNSKNLKEFRQKMKTYSHFDEFSVNTENEETKNDILLKDIQKTRNSICNIENSEEINLGKIKNYIKLIKNKKYEKSNNENNDENTNITNNKNTDIYFYKKINLPRINKKIKNINIDKNSYVEDDTKIINKTNKNETSPNKKINRNENNDFYSFLQKNAKIDFPNDKDFKHFLQKKFKENKKQPLLNKFFNFNEKNIYDNFNNLLRTNKGKRYNSFVNK